MEAVSTGFGDQDSRESDFRVWGMTKSLFSLGMHGRPHSFLSLVLLGMCGEKERERERERERVVRSDGCEMSDG
jgi:hypothetical protein